MTLTQYLHQEQLDIDFSCVRKMSASRNLISVFREFPKELFRVNDGFQVKLRAWTPQRRVYDIHVENGLVLPKALNGSTYIGSLVSVSLLSSHMD